MARGSQCQIELFIFGSQTFYGPLIIHNTIVDQQHSSFLSSEIHFYLTEELFGLTQKGRVYCVSSQQGRKREESEKERIIKGTGSGMCGVWGGERERYDLIGVN